MGVMGCTMIKPQGLLLAFRAGARGTGGHGMYRIIKPQGSFNFHSGGHGMEEDTESKE